MLSDLTQVDRVKRERVVYLLDHWVDIHDPDSVSPQGRPGGGASTPHLSPMSRHPSVVELGRCLAVLKAEHPLWHDHVKAFHCCEWRIRVRAGTRKRGRGRTERLELRDRVRVTPGWVRAGYVNSGVFRLVELFVGPVFLPGELWEALTLSSQEIEERAARRGRAA